jgi:hypothetical protein
MKISHNGQLKNVILGFTSTEYNCSVKLIGRLTFNIEGKAGYADQLMTHELMKPEVKNELIKELALKMSTRETYPPLKTSSPYFPNDSGTYLPNYLLYADSITITPDAPWFSSFKAFIREIQNNPVHGFKVFELPMYSNNTYGGSLWPSKVWGIVPPAMVSRLLLPGIVKDSSIVEGAIALKKHGGNSYPVQDMKTIFDSVA